MRVALIHLMTHVERARAQFLGPFGHFGGDFGKTGTLSRRQIIHLDALVLHTDFF
jgi:hypothetical protein